MKRLVTLAAFAFAAGAQGADLSASALSEGVVEAVQMPAWVERGVARMPVAPGMSLRANDTLRTGPRARLLLLLAEGSRVKLGENGTLTLVAVGMRKDNIFVAAMNVLTGAFRFTTDVLARARGREIDIKIASITAGIRGTDLWGKATEDRDIVCLIEGKIEVQSEGEAAFQMAEPRSFYVAPRGAPALPVQPVDPSDLTQWAAETEIEPGKGAARRDGKWNVILASGESENEVFAVYREVRAAGYPAEISLRRVEGQRIYDVRITHLANQEEAQALADGLDGQYGVALPRVTQ
jgi:hypothetical protein